MQALENSVILIVDDNPTNLEVLSESLMADGFEIGVATSGEGAIAQIAYQQPDLVLLDVMMPGIDGFETCRRLKANPATQDIPIILMTALADATNKVKGLEAGAVDYITKPFQQEEVLARVKIHLQLCQMSKTLAAQNLQLQQLANTLEQRVAERTSALEQAQIHLIQSEKLSALGQLVAGVAHEINNPVGCISSNLAPAQEYVRDISQVLQMYHQRFQTAAPDIAAIAEDIDLEFALEDLPKILNSMESGTARIRDISVSLRNFSRSDTTTFVAVDLHEGLDSTLLILQHRLRSCSDRPTIQVIKQYGNLPRIECHPGQINQVFMNIVSNAIDALEESHTAAMAAGNTPEQPTITITTKQQDQHVIVQFTDNGPGMTEEVLQHLFDPFFTTKAVGKGTGLGMSISHQIITEKHHGTLQCFSYPGQGANFVVEIPITQSGLPR